MSETNADMNAINLEKLKKHPVTMPLLWVGVIFLAGWLGRPATLAYFSSDFFTQVQAAEHVDEITRKLDIMELNQEASDKKMDKHIIEFRTATAFQMEQGLAADLARHNAEPPDTPGHNVDIQNLERRLQLAKDYKNCLLQERRNCDVIQKQIWQ